jgi:hypothetical protein
MPDSDCWTDEDIMHSIRQTIDWLHRLSNLAQKARFASHDEKAAAFVLRDETGTDITDGLRCYFRAIIKRDCPGTADILADRLVQTMILRRKRILHRRKRQRRWALPQVEDTRTKLDILSPVQPTQQAQDADFPPAADETASGDEPPTNQEHRTAPSTLTVSAIDRESYLRQASRSQISRATSAPFQPGEKLLVPPPPRAAQNGSEFVCDYCCLILPSVVRLDRDKWA